MDSIVTRPGKRAGLLIAVALAAAITFTGTAVAPSATAASAAAAAVDTDDTGPAHASFVAPESALVGQARSVTFTVEGNRSAGQPAWVEMYRVDLDTGDRTLVTRHDFIMTTAPQSVTFPVDTSTVDGYMYRLDYDYYELFCGGAMFSYTVFPNHSDTPPPTGTQSSLSVGTSATKVRPGTRVGVMGKVTGAQVWGLRVIAQAKTDRGWTKVGSTKTTSNGRYTLRTSALSLGVRQLKVSVPSLGLSAVRDIKVRR